MMWFIIISLALLLLLTVLLFAPWRVVCQWDGGSVVIRLRFLGIAFPIWRNNVFARSKPAADSRKTRWVTELVERLEAVFDHRDTLVESGRVAMHLARRFAGWWHLEASRVEITLGLGNPAHTGMALGALSAVAGMIAGKWPQVHIYGRANFDSRALSSRGEVIIRIRAWDPVWDIIRTLPSVPWRGLLKLKRKIAYQQ
jgi:hypothetical protein